VTTDPDALVAATIAALEQMPAAQRAMCAAGLIAAVQGADDRRITRIRWAAIAELRGGGMTTAQIADQLGISVGAVDLALQAHDGNRIAPL
jgi:DNA-binding NarL/FixJ family response regulator